ncbi:DUF58 domain-containing protein [Kiritimatiellota bacterium B12222]|nr:DUF58 domain-containing protein [Kiritimatiellota bacterium B12222]
MASSSKEQEPDYMWLLPPEAIRTVTRLEFLSREQMVGTLTGRHRSPNKGYSSEFAQHRPYVRGDDLRQLDWRAYARNDRYYVKEFMEETNLRATILLDASGSMDYTGDQACEVDGKRLSKFQFAQRMSAMLAYLFLGQQDGVSLVSFDSKVRKYLPARSQGKQLRRILSHIHELTPGGETEISEIFHEVAERIPPRGLVIVISDLFDDPDEMVKALHHFRYRNHELVIFHVMAEEEISFPLSGFLRFEDLEGISSELPIDPNSLRVQYIEQVKKFVTQLEKDCGKMKAEYVPVNTKEDIHQVLVDYMERRNRR